MGVEGDLAVISNDHVEANSEYVGFLKYKLLKTFIAMFVKTNTNKL